MRKYGNLLDVRAENVTYKPFHLSRNLRLIYVLNGKIDTRWVAGVHTMNAGEVEIINIDEPVCIEGNYGDNLVLTFEIDREKAKSFCDNIDKALFNCNTTLFYSSTTDTKEQKKLRDMLHILYGHYVGGANEFILEKMIREIVVLIGEKCHDLLNMFNDGESNERVERFFRIYTYIYENFNQKINLKELAESEYVSQQYLSKEFNDKLNINFKDTLEYYRVIQSVRYLVTGKKSITMISELCGFSAPRYFYKHFSLYLKCTPTEFQAIYLSRGEESKRVAVDDSRIKEKLFFSDRANMNPVPTKNYEVRFSEKVLGREIIAELTASATSMISEEISVMEISSAETIENLSNFFHDKTESIPVIFMLYIHEADTENIKKIIFMTEEAAVGAYRMCLTAVSKGLCFEWNNDILDFREEICEITGIDKTNLPLFLISAGYPAQ